MLTRARLSTRWREMLSTLALVALLASVCLGKDLGEGMRLYFAGDYQAAREKLTTVIDQGEVDARGYYFRGLAHFKLGDLEAAAGDFQIGAERELRDQSEGIGQALQRVQGLERLHLEKYRRMAKLKARARQQVAAPAPIPRNSGQPQGTLQLTAMMRVASEVPVKPVLEPPLTLVDRPDATNNGAQSDSSTEIGAGGDQAVGTGVVDASENVVDGDRDPFGNAPSSHADDGDALFDSTAPAETENTSSILGAIFRAVSKATIPRVNTQSMLPPGVRDRVPGSSLNDSSWNEEEDPFAPADGEIGIDEDDPFGDF